MSVKAKKSTPTKNSVAEKVKELKKNKLTPNKKKDGKMVSGDVKSTKKDVKAPASKEKPKNANKQSRGTTVKVEKDSKATTKATTLKDRKKGVGSRDKRSVFLKRVIASTKEQDIVDVLSGIGQIVKVRFIRHQSCAIVSFQEETSVQKAIAMGHIRLKGKLVKINPLKSSPPSINGSRKKKTKETAVKAINKEMKKAKDASEEIKLK